MTKKSSGKLPLVLMCVLLAVTLVVNVLCMAFYPAITTFMTANLNARLTGGSTAETLTPEEAEEAALAMTQELEGEGIVLLENKESALPLGEGTPVNLFGYATVDPIYGGTGSGASDTSSNIDLIQGLENAGFAVNGDLVDFYRSSGVSRVDQGGYTGSNFTPAEVGAEAYTEDLISSAKSFSDVAIVMLSRIGGEGGDLPMDMYAAGYSDTDDGRSCLELTQDEEDLLALVKENFGTVIVLINSSHAMELGFLEEEGIDAALWIGFPGSTGFNAVGEVLSGAVVPSGRLTDIYAYDHTTAPAYWSAGDFTYSNLSNRHYVEYVEGIYIGYRYYETAAADGFLDYDSTVQYPFGYGLSYTTFTQTLKSYDAANGQITMEVEVTNTGDVAGKEVVQVYFTAPYTPGGIEKAHVVLAAFGKTGALEPGASETLTLTFSAEDMASYDYSGSGCYVLEAGTYEIKLMNNSHDVIDQREYEVADTVVYSEGNPRATDLTAAVNQFDDVTNGQITQYVSRADWAGTVPTAREDGKAASDEVVAALTGSPVYAEDPDAQPITFADNGLTLEDMAGLDYDDPQWDRLLEQLSVEDMTNMISNGGWSTPEVPSVGKPATNDLDGPAGINSLVSDLKGVAYTSEVVMGSTWNQTLLEAFGTTYGAEAVANQVVGLYAPGVNLHRTPYSGRNFEYYSEDPLLSGKLCAAMVRGAEAQGAYCYVKHFALNDQESNRLSISVWFNEQSARELYLKAFELTVKEGGTTAMMSSYSYLGATWAGGSRALLTEVLREEWGFQGMVVTDSAMGNTSWMDVNLAIRAGGDMMLCLMGVTLDSSTDTAQQAMRTACHNILYTQANSAAVTVAVDTTPYWLILLIVLDTVVISAALIFFLRRSPLKEKITIPVRVLIVAAVAALTTLVFWLAFFQSGSAPAAGPDSSESPSQSQEVQESGDLQESGQPSDTPADGLYAELNGTGDGWLGCHVQLMTDGTFVILFDYNADNSGIQGDAGTWVENEDGSLTLTGESGTTYTATFDGSAYTAEILNPQTSITCTVTGSPAQGGGQTAADGLYAELNGTGDGWLGCHVQLMTDGTFVILFDYNADNSGIQGDTGTWAENGDGSLTLTGESGTTYTAAFDGSAYTAEVLNPQTSITCTVTGSPAQGGGQTAVDGLYAELNGTGDGWLGCHVQLMTDGTFVILFDYNADNSGIQGDAGTWAENEDGSLTLTGESGTTYTATFDGSAYTAEVLNPQTSITCTVTGAPAGGGQTAGGEDGLLVELYQGDAGGWLGCHVQIMTDGTFVILFDYNADNSGIQGDAGTWAENEDGSLTLTGESGTTYTVTVEGNTYSTELVNPQTAITCNPTGTI